MARKAPEVSLNEDEREALEGLTRRRKTAQALATRARIVLMCAEGAPNLHVSPSAFGRHVEVAVGPL
jgi:hypothetical protein